jgi:hypothetical protein
MGLWEFDLRQMSPVVAKNTGRLMDWYNGDRELPLLEPMFNGPVYAEPRSSGWEKVERDHKAAHPACCACGTLELVEVHHLWPFQYYPELELDERNLISLCRPHHLILGHLGDWKSFNPDVIEMVRDYRRHLDARPHKRLPLPKDWGLEN